MTRSRTWEKPVGGANTNHKEMLSLFWTPTMVHVDSYWVRSRGQYAVIACKFRIETYMSMRIKIEGVTVFDCHKKREGEGIGAPLSNTSPPSLPSTSIRQTGPLDTSPHPISSTSLPSHLHPWQHSPPATTSIATPPRGRPVWPPSHSQPRTMRTTSCRACRPPRHIYLARASTSR